MSSEWSTSKKHLLGGLSNARPCIEGLFESWQHVRLRAIIVWLNWQFQPQPHACIFKDGYLHLPHFKPFIGPSVLHWAVLMTWNTRSFLIREIVLDWHLWMSTCSGHSRKMESVELRDWFYLIKIIYFCNLCKHNLIIKWFNLELGHWRSNRPPVKTCKTFQSHRFAEGKTKHQLTACVSGKATVLQGKDRKKPNKS